MESAELGEEILSRNECVVLSVSPRLRMLCLGPAEMRGEGSLWGPIPLPSPFWYAAGRDIFGIMTNSRHIIPSSIEKLRLRR
jgi:hypothetical protein